MGRSSRSRKPDPIGKGKLTPVQIAYIVDCYLFDNNFTQTRSVFRSEASALIKSPVNEAPRGLLSLAVILDEYISLKEQKVVVEQERIRLERENWRIQTLLRGMQEAMSVYNSSGAGPSTPAIQAPVEKSNPHPVNQSTRSSSGHLAGNATPVVTFSVPQSQTSVVYQKPSSQVAVQPSSIKRKAVNAPEGPSGAKKSRSISSTSSKRLPIKSSGISQLTTNAGSSQEDANPTVPISSIQSNMTNMPMVHSSSIAKRLFTPPKSSGPTTPPRGTSSHSDKSASSSMETPSAAECSNSNSNTPEGTIPTHCTMVSYQKIILSPFKQIIERGKCISSSSPAKKAKGRLDFNDTVPYMPVRVENEVDNTSTSESEKEIDICNMDFPNLDMFGADFSLFSELFVDLDLDSEDVNNSSGSVEASARAMAGISHESRFEDLGADQLMSEYSAAVTQIHSEKDIQVQGENNLIVKSITRCTSVSPVKNVGTLRYQ
ncbi:hypothetical protein SAY86_001451 [Trapa natans]|uniref:Uncharacterized protein n=1 Tax=Trapa natans TaxID=22666 RepID=A0AAN7M5H8_TRANT|nr:hypothetical protein SAY86_001451 [Trapa natans]